MVGRGQTIARIEARGLACLRGQRLLFEGLELALAAGDAALVTGPNGAGKSSLLRILAGLLAPTAGIVTREGAVALAAEAAALDRERTLAQALAFWAGLDGASLADREHALDAVALAPLAEVPVRMLSTGQRKRATLARVIASGAPIWLLDEPGNGLDAPSLARLAETIAAHRAGGGIAIIASHQSLPLPGAIPVSL